MQVDLLDSTQSAYTSHLLRRHSLLVHCMTNDVMQTFTVNTLLALDASLTMVTGAEKTDQLVAIASALLINVSTLTQPRAQAMCTAVERTKGSQTPWTLNLVAMGTPDCRRHFRHELLSFKPAAIRGNTSETMTLAGIADGGWRVGTTGTAANAIPAAQTLARKTGAIVVATGGMDYVTDGRRIIGIHDSGPLIVKVMGTDCALPAIVAACCTLPDGILGSVVSAYHWMKQAEERAVARSEGSGSFVPHFLNALWQLTQEVQA